MKTQHPTLAAGRWKNFSLAEQLAHVGSEVARAIKWLEKGNCEYAELAFWRALELLDLTIAAQKAFTRLKELTRIRELLVDYFWGKNEYRSSTVSWQRYFLPFVYYLRIHK